jgi:hypothetical protein
MADMRLWNGSEFQLLRFLGRHRHELEGCILRNTNINSELDLDMEWLEYPYGNKDGKIYDAELTGIMFLPPKTQMQLLEKWKNYWPQGGQSQSWDAVLCCWPVIPDSEKKEEWIIVEAKAHLNELESSSKAGDESKEKIASAFEATQKRFNIQTQNSWFEKYYQLANRLAFINFLLDNDIQGSILNIYFINGWPDDPVKNVVKKEAWQEKIKDEYDYLGLTTDAKKYISEIFINCNGRKKPSIMA